MKEPMSKRPGIKAFLDALDQVLNSNSFLLDCPIDLTIDDSASRLEALIRSQAFKDLLIEGDIERGWMNYGEWDPEANRYTRLHHGGHFHRAGCSLTMHALDRAAVRQRLVHLLTGTASPYHRQLSESAAAPLVGAFLDELLGEHPEEWAFLAVDPTFLHTSGYYGNPTRPPGSDDFAYFDGGEGDSSTVFYRRGATWMLLTNGSP